MSRDNQVRGAGRLTCTEAGMAAPLLSPPNPSPPLISLSRQVQHLRNESILIASALTRVCVCRYVCPCRLHRRRCCTATTTTCTTTTTTTTTAAAGIKQQSPSRLVKDRQKPKLEHGTDYNVGGQDTNRCLQRRHFTAKTVLFDSSLSLLDAQWRNQVWRERMKEKKKIPSL